MATDSAHQRDSGAVEYMSSSTVWPVFVFRMQGGGVEVECEHSKVILSVVVGTLVLLKSSSSNGNLVEGELEIGTVILLLCVLVWYS